MLFGNTLADKQRIGLHLLYAMFAIGPYQAIPALVAVAGIYYIQRHWRAAAAQMHFQWLRQTFWWALAAALVAELIGFLFLDTILLVAVGGWYLYRVARGWLALFGGTAINTNNETRKRL